MNYSEKMQKRENVKRLFKIYEMKNGWHNLEEFYSQDIPLEMVEKLDAQKILIARTLGNGIIQFKIDKNLMLWNSVRDVYAKL